MNKHSSNENRKKGPLKWLTYLGPGFITAALVFGPGSLTVTSKLGAEFGNQFLWVIVIATFFMIVFMSMSIRIGLATDVSLLTTIRDKWGKIVSGSIGLGIFLVVTAFQAGNAVGAGLAFSELSGTSITPWIILFTAVSIFLLYFKSFYKILEKLMLLLVSIMFISFLGTLLIIAPGFKEIMIGFVPTLPSGSMLLAIALIASSFSIVGAFYQSYLVQEKQWKINQLKSAHAESISGIVMLGLIGSIILICAGVVLFPLNAEINSAADMGLAIEPLFGRFATVLFMIGLFGASFSSLIGNATIGGTLLSDALGYGYRLNDRSTRFFIMIVMITGAIVAVWFGGIPIDLIVFAQGITIFIVPFIGIILFITANSKDVLGELRNGTGSRIVGYIGIILLIILALRNAYLIFN